MKSEELVNALHTVAADRHKLVILLGGFGSGKTALLKRVTSEVGGVYVNLNLLLAERLLALPRSRHGDGVTANDLVDMLCEEMSTASKRPLLVDNVELLFSPELGRLNPIDTFTRVARERPLVLALPARRQGAYAEYSTVGAQDYMHMALESYPIVNMDEESS